MANFLYDPHFRDFSKKLREVIAKYDPVHKDDLLEFQRNQMETLIDLEDQYRKAIINVPIGVEVYQAFITYIKEEKSTILSARPYFRERSSTFEGVSFAIKNNLPENLFPFSFNYNFIHVTKKLVKLPTNIGLQKLDKEIKKLRNDMMILNMPLAINRAKMFYDKVPKDQLSYLDMVQIAVEGLSSAVDKFVPPEGGLTAVWRSVIIGRIVGELIESYCVSADTILNPIGQPPKTIKDFIPGDKIHAVSADGQTIETEVLKLHDHGMLQGYEIEFDDGYKIICSSNHKFLTNKGMTAIKDIAVNNLEVLCEKEHGTRWNSGEVRNRTIKDEGLLRSSEDLRSMSFFGNSGTNRVDDEGKSEIQETGRLGRVLWPSNGNETEENGSHSQLQRLSKDSAGETDESCIGDGKGADFSEWLDESVWTALFEAQRAMDPSRNMFYMSAGSTNGTDGRYEELERGQSREGSAEYGECEQGLSSKSEGRSGTGRSSLQEDKADFGSVPEGQSGRILRQYEKSLVSPEAFEDGSLVKVEQYSDLGARQRKVLRGSKTSGLRKSGPQDMDRSGRKLSLSGNIYEYPSITKNTGTGRNVEQGMPKTSGCDVNSVSDDVLCVEHRKTERRMANVAYSDAPLTSTGSLLRRRVISVRSVGERHMYDLEVAHPKHNFLLPNGIVTSNSATMLHFFPNDRRKLYHSNKVSRKHRGTETDYGGIAKEINDKKILDTVVTPEEIGLLMNASSHISSDSFYHEDKEQEVKVTKMMASRYVADASMQPDVRVEKMDLQNKLQQSMQNLSVFEQKILRLKGV